jgi:NAD(P)-dependent dehydrogenase (short-subunit alcohol dehydrogenase family)
MDGSGRKVLLTGASGGIGRAIAHQLADTGARLLLSARDAIRLAELARELPQDTVTVVADITSTIDRAAFGAGGARDGHRHGHPQRRGTGVRPLPAAGSRGAAAAARIEPVRTHAAEPRAVAALAAAGDGCAGVHRIYFRQHRTPRFAAYCAASSGCVVWQSACGESWLIPVYVCITWHRARPALR